MTHPCPFENSCHEEVYIEYLKNQTNWRDIILTFETMYFFNSLPNDKNLDQSKFKDLANDKVNVTQKLNFILGRVENIVVKRENACNQHFLLFPQSFQKLSFSGSLKSRDCVVKS